MLDKIKTILDGQLVKQLRDIRVLGFAVFGVIVLLVSWSGVKVIETNYDLQKQVSKIQQENQVSELENNNLTLQNQYYNTDQYVELQARRQFGKGLPGEKLVLVPKSVALAHTVDVSRDDVQPGVYKSSGHKPLYQRNFEAWRDFLTHGKVLEES
jgi:cell division protein FtsB